MLMALESGQVAAEAITPQLPLLRQGFGFESLANDYQAEYSRRFQSRLRVSGLLRRAAFVPHLDEAAILFLGNRSRLRRKLAQATRRSTSRELRTSSG
jgi:flavin-dependent dehydrogenase